LWPFFSYRRDELFRVFPLFGCKEEGPQTSTFFLWPFFTRERGPERDVDAVLPLFRLEQGPSHWNMSVLWPFFNYNRDEAAPHTSVDFPWPLVRRASGSYEETRIFPLYWNRDEGPSYRYRAVLWPLWSRTLTTTPGEGTEKTTSILILNRITTGTDPSG
jgi:hypothetical protein